jgi:serine/threonine protein kinase
MTSRGPGLAREIQHADRAKAEQKILRVLGLMQYAKRSVVAPRFTQIREFSPDTRQLLWTVENCHGRGIIHRDIKPSNIIVTETGELRLIDFDVAAYRGARSTLPGYEDVRIGTLPYSAPEQILDPATATYETADIYSLGVVLYEMLTGRIPFPMTDDEDEEEYRARLPFEEPVPPTAYRPDLAPEIEAVLLRAMRRDPSERQQSVAELRTELEAAFRAAGVPVDPRSAASLLRRATPVLLLAPLLLSLLAWLFFAA